MAGHSKDIDAAFDELLDDAVDAEEVRDDAKDKTKTKDTAGGSKKRSQFEDGLDGFQNIVGGLAARLLGANAAKRLDLDPEKTVISPEVDRVIEDIGDTLGRLLGQAGDELKKAAKKADAARSEEPRKAGGVEHDDAADPDADLEGWSPLVIGARAFASGVGAVAADFVEKVTPVVENAMRPKSEE